MKTVEVKIYCVVGSNGKWSAGGPTNDPSLYSDFIDDDGEYPEVEQGYWVTCELPIPEIREVSPIKTELA